MYTLDSPAREVIEGCREVVQENGDGLDGCYWAERGLEVCGDLTFREVIDLGGDLHMMAAQVLILPYLQPLFDRPTQLYIARACAKHPAASAWLLHLYGDKLPGDARAEAGKNAAKHHLRGLARSESVERLRRDRAL